MLHKFHLIYATYNKCCPKFYGFTPSALTFFSNSKENEKKYEYLTTVRRYPFFFKINGNEK